MAKFIFFCRRCGKTFKEKGSTLQVAQGRLRGRLLPEVEKGFICTKCCDIEYEERKAQGIWWHEDGTIAI